MTLKKPYYRIARPKAKIYEYVVDMRYAGNWKDLSRGYLNLEKGLINIFNYIEAAEDNLKVYSYELYKLLFQACNEVELNCKLILDSNGARPINNNKNGFNMNDYRKLENSSKLSKYKILLPNWRKKGSGDAVEFISKEFSPFENFAKPATSLPWYKAYNNVKHNRQNYIEEANLENCINAIGAVLVLLYSQFGALCIDGVYENKIYYDFFEEKYDFNFTTNTLFNIKPPKITDWSDAELYDFSWDAIKNTEEPFEKYPFN